MADVSQTPAEIAKCPTDDQTRANIDKALEAIDGIKQQLEAELEATKPKWWRFDERALFFLFE